MNKKINRKGTLVLLIVLQILVVATMVAEIFHKNFFNVFLCLLTLVLFYIPRFVDLKLNIKLPTALETVILLFIFSAEILGEIQSFYTLFPQWDTILHAINGFIMAAIGFAMIDILNQDPRFHINLSPFFVAFVAFCFAMTIGVLWEFFEFGMDQLFGFDMQKDALVHSIHSVAINPSGLNETVALKEITGAVVNYAGGQYVIEGGYLDIGVIDTMKDLIVNCVGAIIFSVIGIIYIKHRGKGRLARSFIPRLKTSEEIEQTHVIMENLKKRRNKYERNKITRSAGNNGGDNINCGSSAG